VLQDARTYGCRTDLSACQHVCHGIDLTAVQRGHRPDLHLLHPLVGHQTDGVTSPRVERIEQRLVYVREGDHIAGFAEKLAHEPAADVARTEDDGLFHSYTCPAKSRKNSASAARVQAPRGPSKS